MGRAMIIICSAVLISLGIVGLSTSNLGRLLTEQSTKYANEMTAKNTAHTAIQIAMQNINKDSDWIKNHDSPAEAWEENISGSEIMLYLETLNDPDANSYWEEDSLRIISKATFANKHNATVTSLYLKSPFSSLVPDFTGAMQFASNNIIPAFDGSASISGFDQSGQCEELGIPTDVPAVSVKGDISDAKYAEIQNEYDDLKESSGGIEKVTGLNYEPTDELIARLENSGNRTVINDGYTGSLGTAENPGVFFIEPGADLKGAQKEGYGIMVIKSDATLKYDGEFKVASNFKFHGLVIFENAFDFVGRGTPTIYGSVLVGHTQAFLDDPTVPAEAKEMDVDISGNIHLQYDCQGQSYAKMAAAESVKQHRYTRVVTFEEVGF